MTGRPCTVATCDRLSHDGLVCHSCTAALRQALAETAWVVGQLHLVESRRTSYGSSGLGVISRSAEKVLPFDVRAAEARRDLHAKLASWCRLLHEEYDGRAALPRDGPASIARWLLARLDIIRRHEAGHEAVEDLCAAYATARWVIDRPAERWYAGPCDECEADLYARPGRQWVVCAACELQYDVAARRQWLLDQARDRSATASEIARAVVVWTDYARGESRLVRRIADWHARGRITDRGHAPVLGHMRPLYRVGDVLDLLRDELQDPAA